MLKISKLAARDYFHEWQISGCYVLALGAVLGPLLILFGLKFGIVGNLVGQLVEEPRNREIRPVSSSHYNLSWFSEMRLRNDVDFIIPRKRNLAANIKLKSKTAKTILDVELIPTAKNDPLLPNIANPPSNIHWLVLSTSAANKLAVQRGDVIDGSIARIIEGKTQRVHVQLHVQAIASPTSFNRDGAFGSLALLEALEHYRDGYSVPELDWPGEKKQKSNDYYTGFRLFAKTLDDVQPLKKWLNEQGIDVRTRAHEIEVVKQLDIKLTTVYWVIALTSLVGYVLSLGASLWANIDRKYKELCILRLTGFRTIEIIFFPIVQGLLTAILGWILAIDIFHLASFTMSKMMAEELDVGQQVCRLLPIHYFMALALTCCSVVFAAFLAGIRATKGEPTEGLREL
jgi:putative ABC transport system permease protein